MNEINSGGRCNASPLSPWMSVLWIAPVAFVYSAAARLSLSLTARVAHPRGAVGGEVRTAVAFPPRAGRQHDRPTRRGAARADPRRPCGPNHIATALSLGATLLTKDRKILLYAHVKTLRLAPPGA